MAQLKGNPVYILAIAAQLARANVHFEVKFDFEGCVIKCRYDVTLQAAVDAHERMTVK